MILNRFGRDSAQLLHAKLGANVLFLGLVALSVFISAAVIWDFYSSRFLFYDDTIFIGRYVFGEDVPPLKHFMFFRMLEIFALAKSIWVFKILLIVQPIVIGSLFASILYRISHNFGFSLLLAITIISYPVSTEQNFFVTGSHPTTATAVFAIYLLLVVGQMQDDLKRTPLQQIPSVCLQGVLVLLCSKLSPTFTLAPVVVLVSTSFLVYRQFENRGLSKNLVMLFVIGALPLAFGAALYGSYHYDQLEGWLLISIAQVFTNLSRAIAQIVVSPFNYLPYLGWVYVLALGAFVSVLLLSVRQLGSLPSETGRRDAVALFVICLLSAALFFGPSSIVTMYTGRYAVAPYYMTVLALFIPLAFYVRRMRSIGGTYSHILHGSLLVLALTSVFHGAYATKTSLEPFLAGHRAITKALAKREWSGNEQIYILLSKEQRATSVGLNHWSTWYLRVVTGNPKIIGVVGELGRHQIHGNTDLFVESYRDHGPEYWTVVNGRSERKQMIGLERRRPLFVFKQNKKGRLRLVPAAVWDQATLQVLEPGQSPADGNVDSKSSICNAASGKNFAFLGHRAKLPVSQNLTMLDTYSFETDGTKSTSIDLKTPSNLLTVLRVRLSSRNAIDQGATAIYTETTPAMPMLSQSIAVYEMPNEFHIVDRRSNRTWLKKRSKDEELSVVMVGCQNQFAFLWVDDKLAGVVRKPSFDGTWKIGGGFKSRFWNGTLEELSVQTFSVDPRILDLKDTK